MMLRHRDWMEGLASRKQVVLEIRIIMLSIDFSELIQKSDDLLDDWTNKEWDIFILSFETQHSRLDSSSTQAYENQRDARVHLLIGTIINFHAD